MKKAFLNRYHSEIPLKEEKSNLFLEVSTAVSVFLFSIVLAAYFMMTSMVSSWNKSIIDGLTVQIMPSSEALTADEELLRLNKVISFFDERDGVEKVRVISNEQIKHIMSPWLGENANIENLPIPKLLDVKLKNGKTFDYQKVSSELKEVASYASIDNHGIWLQKLMKSAAALKMLSLFVLAVVLSALAFSLFYAVQTSLRVHQNIIEILHIMGATDNYVAKQYAKRGLWTGFISSVIGTILGFGVLIMISHLSSGLETGLIGSAKLSLWHWGTIALLPPMTAVLSMILSFLSVKQTLGKMM